MEVLLPLLIFAGGIIYSVIASTGNKNNEERNVDPSKMERPGRAAPRGRTSTSQNQEQQGSGGLFDEIRREFKQEYDKAMGRSDTETDDNRPRFDKEDVKRRADDQRKKLEEKWQQEKQQASMRERSRDKTYRDKRPVERKQSERAEKARDSVYTGAYDGSDDIEVAEAAEGIGREVADDARYSFGDDRTTLHERDREKDEVFSPKDLVFDKKAVVNGVIFNEILNKPKSRK